MRAELHSKKTRVMIGKIVKNSKPEKVRLVLTLKSKHFEGNRGDNFGDNFRENFQKLLMKLSSTCTDNFVGKWLDVSKVRRTSQAG